MLADTKSSLEIECPATMGEIAWILLSVYSHSRYSCLEHSLVLVKYCYILGNPLELTL